MTTVPIASYSIGQASELTGMSTHTLRFYEKEGLFFDLIQRDASGRRRFTAAQIDWLIIGGKLRAARMPLPEIRRYAQAGRAGEGGAQIQLQLLYEHKKRVQHQLAELTQVLEAVSSKIAAHEGGD